MSVVLSTNRDVPFLTEALASVTAQTLSSWEIVIVDNGSGIGERLNEIAGRHPRCTVVHQEGTALPLAFNAGAVAATGEFLTFLGDDDVWRPERLELLVAALDADPGATACFSLAEIIDEDGVVTNTDWAPVGASAADLLHGRVDFPHIVTMLVRREEFFRLGAFSPLLRFTEDTELTLRMLLFGRVIGVPEVLVEYRRHSQNATNLLAERLHRSSRTMLRAHIAAAADRGDDEARAALESNLAMLNRRSARDGVGDALTAAYAHRYLDAGRHAARAFIRSPRTATVEVWSRARRKAGRRTEPAVALSTPSR